MLRRGLVPAGFAALVLVAMPTGGGGVRALPLAAGPETPTLAFVYGKFAGARLAHLDARRMRVSKARSVALHNVDAWAYDPTHRVLAVASNSDPWDTGPDTLRFVQASTLRLTGSAVKLATAPRALFWRRTDRIVAVAGGVIETVDVADANVISTTRFGGEIATISRGGDELALLETPPNKIGAPTLHVIAADGSDRTVVLRRISAGFSRPDPTTATDYFTTLRIPAVAVDSAGAHAYVVQPDGPAADVDLANLTVSYHDLRAPSTLLRRLSGWLTPPAEAKGWSGPGRRATWLGDGLIAVTGTNATIQHDASGSEMSNAPAGLAIVDTRDWSVRMLDAGADTALVASHLLVATGATSDGTSGIGLSAYGPDGKLKFRLFGRANVSVATVVAGRAYVLSKAKKEAVVDLRAGRVIGHRSYASLPFPLVGDSSIFY